MSAILDFYMDKLTLHRKARLLKLVERAPYRGNQQVFAAKVGLSKGRISQMLDPDESFGERSARALASKLRLDDRYFEDGFAAGEGRENAGAAPRHMDEGERFVYWLNKISDRDLRDRARDAAMQLIYSAGDGMWPPAPPTPEPHQETQTAPFARPSRVK